MLQFIFFGRGVVVAIAPWLLQVMHVRRGN